ncbi:MAG: Ni/Fe hydrogenase subunit alpha [Chloroflexi bacterium]|nr:Ni/Fe hydrogenase subunit alpha [Chloroflexota bacterium]
MARREIKVDYLARVEGEGALDLVAEDGRLRDIRLSIFEPPRLFEAFLVNRTFDEVPDMTARICGICPVAYQMSSVHAIEKAFGMSVGGQLRQLRRLLYCGEWLESHLLHMLMLSGPDFMGYESVIPMARDHPELVNMGLRMKRTGNSIVSTLGGREIHPVSVRAGGFYRILTKGELEKLLPHLRQAKEDSLRVADWAGSLPFPDFRHDAEYAGLYHPEEYPMNEGRVVSNRGIDIAPEEFLDYFAVEQVPYSTALQYYVKGRGAFFTGPLARVNLNFDNLVPEAKEMAQRKGIEFPNPNPFVSIFARALEVIYCFDHAISIIASYREPEVPYIRPRPRASAGAATTEAPRGMLYHRYELDDQGRVLTANLIPPTAMNQRQIEQDLRDYVPGLLHLPDEQVTLKAEAMVRNYDPCISCSSHALKVRVRRE